MLPPDVSALIRSRAGIATYADLLGAGLDPATVRRLERAGHLLRLRVGAYTDGLGWASLGVPARELLRARAVSATMREPHVLSHDSAAHALGIEFLAPARRWVHVTRPRVLGGRGCTGVKHHGAPYVPAQVVRTPGWTSLDLARTAVDLAREHGVWVGVSACDSALGLGAARDDLERAVETMAHWPGVRAARRAIELGDAGAENPGESLARMVLAGTGFGRPETQFPVRIGGRVAWCDLRVGAHVVEFDGRAKYLRAHEGGLAGEAPGEVVWRERQRERGLLDAGLGVSRVTWAQLQPAEVARTQARLAGEIAATYARVGPSPAPGVLAYAAAMAQQRAVRLRRDRLAS